MTDTLPPWINPRSVTVEARWLPVPGREHRLAVLERELTGREPWQVISSMQGWLSRKAMGQSDPTSAGTRSTYRKILSSLADVDPDDDGGMGARRGGRPGRPGPFLEVDDLPAALRALEREGIRARVCAGERRRPSADVHYRRSDELPEAA